MKLAPLTVLVLLFIAQFALYEYMAVVPERSAPADKVYNRISGYDSVYVSWMRQSALGSWSIRDQRTTAAIPGVFIYPLFIFLGKLAGVLHVDVEYVYFLSKVIGGVLAFIAVYAFIADFFPRAHRNLALILVLGIEMGPWWYKEASIFGLGIVLRHFGVAHHTIGEAAGLVFLLLYYRNLYDSRLSRMVWMFILGVFATSILLPFMVQLWITTAVVFGGIALYRHLTKSYLVTTALAGLSVGIPALFYKYEFSLGAPWNNSAGAESVFYATRDVVIRYLGSLAYYVPFFIAALIFLPKIWGGLSRKLQDVTILSITGVCMPFFLLAILPMVPLPIANFRFIDAYIPVYPGIVATVALAALRRRVGKLTVVITVLVLLASGYTTVRFTRATTQDREKQWVNTYVPVPVWQAVQFLHTVPVNSGVLALEHFGDVIADHTPVRVYVGMNPVYADFWQRVVLARQFYSGSLPQAAAQDFLHGNDISYIFYGPLEQLETKVSPLYPDLLSVIFQNDQATVYKVIPPVR